MAVDDHLGDEVAGMHLMLLRLASVAQVAGDDLAATTSTEIAVVPTGSRAAESVTHQRVERLARPLASAFSAGATAVLVARLTEDSDDESRTRSTAVANDVLKAVRTAARHLVLLTSPESGTGMADSAIHETAATLNAAAETAFALLEDCAGDSANLPTLLLIAGDTATAIDFTGPLSRRDRTPCRGVKIFTLSRSGLRDAEFVPELPESKSAGFGVRTQSKVPRVEAVLDGKSGRAFRTGTNFVEIECATATRRDELLRSLRRFAESK